MHLNEETKEKLQNFVFDTIQWKAGLKFQWRYIPPTFQRIWYLHIRCIILFHDEWFLNSRHGILLDTFQSTISVRIGYWLRDK